MRDFFNKPRSLYDVADDVVSQLDNGTDDADSGSVSSLEPIAAKNAPTSAATNPPHVNAFFDQQHDRIAALAKEMNVPENYLLGLSAGESTWGQPPQGHNNLFGFSDAKGHPRDFDSFDDAIDGFRKSQWYNRLQGKTDLNDFTNELVDTTGGKTKYNPVRSNYDQYIQSVIKSVDRRLPIWEQSR